MSPHQQHRPDDVCIQRRTDADSVAAEQVDLQLPEFLGRDALIRQLSEPGLDSVDGPPLGDGTVHDRAGGEHALARVVGQARPDGSAPQHPPDGGRPEGAPIDLMAEGQVARTLQHAHDHLSGVVFLDRMRDLRSLAFGSEWNRYLNTAGSAKRGEETH